MEAAVGHPDMPAFWNDVMSAHTESELEGVIHRATGSSDLMVFMRMDPGEILRREKGREAVKSLRFLIGNPLTMRQMAKHVPDAASYAPVTILVDERPDGVHLSYDRMARLLAPYGSEDALRVARGLDAKVEALLVAAAK